MVQIKEFRTQIQQCPKPKPNPVNARRSEFGAFCSTPTGFAHPAQVIGYTYFRYRKKEGRRDRQDDHPDVGRTKHNPVCKRPYIASGLSIPSQLRTSISSRSAMAAVASRKVFRAGSSSLRIG